MTRNGKRTHMHLLQSQKATQPHTHRWIPPRILCGTHRCGDRDALTLGNHWQPRGTGRSPQHRPRNPAAALTASATARHLWLKHNRKISPTIAGKPAPPSRLRQDPCSQSQPSALRPQQNTSCPSHGQPGGEKAGRNGSSARASQQDKGCGGTVVTRGLGEGELSPGDN